MGRGWCGNINNCRPEEIVTLEPGQAVALQWLEWPNLSSIGMHDVSIEIEHIPDLKWSGVPIPRHDPAVLHDIAQVPAFKATSNVVQIRVLPP